MPDAADRADFYEQLRKRFFSGAWTGTVGIAGLDFGEGKAVLHAVPGANLIQSQGVVQGGFLVAFADAAGSMSVLSLAERSDERVATIEIKVNFLLPVREGDRIRAEGHVVRRGRRIALAESRVELADGRLAAQGLATFIITPANETD